MTASNWLNSNTCLNKIVEAPENVTIEVGHLSVEMDFDWRRHTHRSSSFGFGTSDGNSSTVRNVAHCAM